MLGGLRWGLETGEIAHLLPRGFSLAFARPASTPWALLSYARNRSRQSIMSASIVFRRQEDIALVDMVAERSVL